MVRKIFLIYRQYGGISGSGVIYGTGATSMYGINTGAINFRGSEINYAAAGSAAAEAQAAVYGAPIMAGSPHYLSGSGINYHNGHISNGIINPVGGLQTNIAMNNYNNCALSNQNAIGGIQNPVGFGINNLSVSGAAISGGTLSQNIICSPSVISPNIIQGGGVGMQNMNTGLINNGVIGTGVSIGCNKIGTLGIQNGYVNQVNSNLVGSPSSFSVSNTTNCANHLAGTYNLGSERALLGYPNSRTNNNC